MWGKGGKDDWGGGKPAWSCNGGKDGKDGWAGGKDGFGGGKGGWSGGNGKDSWGGGNGKDCWGGGNGKDCWSGGGKDCWGGGGKAAWGGGCKGCWGDEWGKGCWSTGSSAGPWGTKGGKAMDPWNAKGGMMSGASSSGCGGLCGGYEKGKSKGGKGPPTKKMFVGGLKAEIVEERIREWAEMFGPVEDIRLLRDQEGKARGYCFVDFKSVDDAIKCYDNYANNQIDGNWVDCKPASGSKPKPGDWYCGMCGNLVFATRNSCNVCGYTQGYTVDASAARRPQSAGTPY